MGHLPHLRHERPDRLVLNSDQQASAILIGLARAMWDNLAQVGGHPDGTGQLVALRAQLGHSRLGVTLAYRQERSA